MNITSPNKIKEMIYEEIIDDRANRLDFNFVCKEEAKFIDSALSAICLINEMIRERFMSKDGDIINEYISTVLKSLEHFEKRSEFLKDKISRFIKLIDKIELSIDAKESDKH